MASNLIYKYTGSRRFNGLPQGDITADEFEALPVHRRHIVLHSGDWEGGNAIESPDFAGMKRAELDAAAPDYGLDAAAFDKADDLRAAIIAAYEKGVR